MPHDFMRFYALRLYYENIRGLWDTKIMVAILFVEDFVFYTTKHANIALKQCEQFMVDLGWGPVIVNHGPALVMLVEVRSVQSVRFGE